MTFIIDCIAFNKHNYMQNFKISEEKEYIGAYRIKQLKTITYDIIQEYIYIDI